MPWTTYIILLHVGSLIRWVLDCMIAFIAPYTFITQDYRQYSAVADLHLLQFTITHALGFSVSLSLQIIHDVFFAQPNSFLAVILQLPIMMTQLSSSPLLPSSYLGRLASQTQLFISDYCSWSHLLTVSFYNPSAWITQKTQPLLLRRRVYWSVA
jgi:hypothetical protein